LGFKGLIHYIPKFCNENLVCCCADCVQDSFRRFVLESLDKRTGRFYAL